MSSETCPRSGFVYVLSNPAMPGIVKVGKTSRDVPVRVAELFQAGVPVPFDVVGSVYSPDCHVLERRCHAGLGRYRVDAGREFFRCSSEKAMCIVNDEHRLHIEEMIDAYLPDHTPVPHDDFIDTSSLRILAEEFEVSFGQLCDLLDELAPEDLLRLQTKRDLRIAKLDAELKKREMAANV